MGKVARRSLPRDIFFFFSGVWGCNKRPVYYGRDLCGRFISMDMYIIFVAY